MINKIEEQIKVIKSSGEIYEITVKNIKTDKIEYQAIGFGGLFCSVEKILSFSNGYLRGTHQVIGWGNPMLMFYSLQRIQEFMKENSSKLLKVFSDARKEK